MKSHTDREIVPEQAATVVRIFEMFASGMGRKTIAKRLRTEHGSDPSAIRISLIQRGKSTTAAVSVAHGVRPVLRAPATGTAPAA